MTTRVAVLGAGMAGMAAALDLVDAGLDVTLIEARDRVGGRVLTLREPFTHGIHVEAGARFILGDHVRVLDLARRLDVALDPLPTPAAERFVVHARGHRVVVGSGGEEMPFALEAPEQRGVRATYVDPMLRVLGDPDASDWPSPEAACFDAVTFRELLTQRGASKEALAQSAIGPSERVGDGGASVSALSILRREVYLGRAGDRPARVVRGGTDRLPVAMGRALGDRVQLGCAVRAVHHDAAGVTVHATHAGRSRAVLADYTVCALPLPLLETVDFSPSPPLVTRAAREVASTSVVRVYLQCRSAPWKSAGVPADALTDLPIAQAFDATPAEARDGRCVVEAYVTGADARALAAKTESERVSLALGHMERVHPGVTAAFELGASYAWRDDPWARGAYVWFRPGQLTRFRSMGQPEGRLHFAGDHTSPTPGWMEGAIASGRRAAREILERVRGEHRERSAGSAD